MNKKLLDNIKVKNVCANCGMLIGYCIGGTKVFYRDGMHQCGQDKDGKIMSFCNTDCDEIYHKKLKK